MGEMTKRIEALAGLNAWVLHGAPIVHRLPCAGLCGARIALPYWRVEVYCPDCDPGTDQ